MRLLSENNINFPRVFRYPGEIFYFGHEINPYLIMNEEINGQPGDGKVPSATKEEAVENHAEEITEVIIGQTEEEVTPPVGYEDLSDIEDMALLRRMAEEEHNPSAMFQLGYNYHEGQHCGQDYKMAMVWYQKAAAYGHAVAQYNLSLLYANGTGVKVDKRKAFYYAQSGAIGGYPLAQVNTGYYYLNGFGISRNIKGALYWSVEAADNGEETAAENVELIRNNFKLTDQGDLAPKAYRRGLLPALFIVISALLGVWMTIGYLSDLKLTYDKFSVVLAILQGLTLLSGSVMLFLRKKEGLYAILANVILYMIYIAVAQSGDGFLIAFNIPVLVGLFLRGKDGESLYSTCMQNTGIGQFFEEVGYGPEYEPVSPRTTLYKALSIASIAVLAFITFILILNMIRGWTGFSMEVNMFKSPLTPFLWVVGFILGLKQKTESYKTYDVYENKYTGEKRYEESGDITDSMMGGIMMPLIQRFILIPLAIAAVIYYAIYLLVKIISGILPYCVLILAVAGLVGLLLFYLRNGFKKQRLYIMAVISFGLALMMTCLWLV